MNEEKNVAKNCGLLFISHNSDNLEATFCYRLMTADINMAANLLNLVLEYAADAACWVFQNSAGLLMLMSSNVTLLSYVGDVLQLPSSLVLLNVPTI